MTNELCDTNCRRKYNFHRGRAHGGTQYFANQKIRVLANQVSGLEYYRKYLKNLKKRVARKLEN